MGRRGQDATTKIIDMHHLHFACDIPEIDLQPTVRDLEEREHLFVSGTIHAGGANHHYIQLVFVRKGGFLPRTFGFAVGRDRVRFIGFGDWATIDGWPPDRLR